ncbi:MAG: hypothetical protein ACTSVL_12750 [Promethearchaeota archaeon]
MQTENEAKNKNIHKPPTLFKWSFELYRDFYQIYILTLLIGIVIAIFLAVIMFLMFGVPKDVDIANPLFGSDDFFSSLKKIASLLLSFIILSSTVESLFGISQEIYEKGDYSGTLKQVILNFMKNWFFYIVSGTISFIGFTLIDVIVPNFNNLGDGLLSISLSFFIRNSLSFLWIILNCIFISCYLKEKSVINGFRHFSSVFRKRGFQIFKNFLQILGPAYLFSYLFIFVYGYYIGPWYTQLIYFLGLMAFLVICLFILFPLTSIISQITVSQYYASLETKDDKNKTETEFATEQLEK